MCYISGSPIWIHALKKKISGFPVPSRDVTNQTLPGRGIIRSFPARERVWLVWLGTGKSKTFFYTVGMRFSAHYHLFLLRCIDLVHSALSHVRTIHPFGNICLCYCFQNANFGPKEGLTVLFLSLCTTF
jgi:hypothetical protein